MGVSAVSMTKRSGKKKLVALYFSAHWYAPCRKFTPQLVKFHNRVAPQHPEFEIVFISSIARRLVWKQTAHCHRSPYRDLIGYE
jgi:Thioredoxin-like